MSTQSYGFKYHPTITFGDDSQISISRPDLSYKIQTSIDDFLVDISTRICNKQHSTRKSFSKSSACSFPSSLWMAISDQKPDVFFSFIVDQQILPALPSIVI